MAGPSEPRWLDDDEQRTWRTFMGATRLLFAQLDRDLERRTAISAAYYEVLVALSEAPQRTMRMSDLAERSLASRSRLSHAVAKLEQLGWVRRESCPSDRRGAFAVLTGEGFAALAAAAPVHVESVRGYLFDALDGSELAVLRSISERILAGLAGSGDVPGCRGHLGDTGAGPEQESEPQACPAPGAPTGARSVAR